MRSLKQSKEHGLTLQLRSNENKFFGKVISVLCFLPWHREALMEYLWKKLPPVGRAFSLCSR